LKGWNLLLFKTWLSVFWVIMDETFSWLQIWWKHFALWDEIDPWARGVMLSWNRWCMLTRSGGPQASHSTTCLKPDFYSSPSELGLT
jgi:hypothetical protein